MLPGASGHAQSNVGIGNPTPDASSLLDLTSTTMGFLTPRMTQAQRNAITTPATGLLIYQTDNTPTFYYYTGTIWTPFLSSGSGWGLTGNAATVASTNFLGTTDSIDLRVRTNNTERMSVTALGRVGIGTTTPGRPLEIILDPPANTYSAYFRSTTAGYGVAIGSYGPNSTYGAIQAMTSTGTVAPLAINAALGGNVGINTQAPNTRVDINGDLATRAYTYAASNGAQDNININGYTFIRITGPTAAFTINGIAGGYDGKIVILYNTTGSNMTIGNNASGTAANSILTLTGTAISTTGTGCVTLIYDGTAASPSWIVTAVQQ